MKRSNEYATSVPGSPAVLSLLVSLLLSSGCASASSPLEDRSIRLAHTWLDRSIEEATERLGEPTSVTERNQHTWFRHTGPDDFPCRAILQSSSEGEIVRAEVRGLCPGLDELKKAGWVDPVTTEGLRTEYERFYQVYRVSTRPQTIAVGFGQPFVDVLFLGGFHRDRPGSIVRGLVLRAEGGSRADAAANPLSIPVAGELHAEARILVDSHDAFSVVASETIPLRGLTGMEDYLFLSLDPSIVNRLLLARTVELLLPGGVDLALPAEQVREMRGALLVLYATEQVRRAAEFP